MTEKTRRHFKRGFDVSKWPMAIGTGLLLMHQSVDLRGKIVAQQEHQQSTASSVVSVMKDVSALSGKVVKLDGRVTRLERPLRTARAGSLHGTAAPDTVAARSPGLVGAAVDLVSAPFRFLGAVFRGR